MSSPPSASVARALELLFCLGAIDGNSNLTQIGGEALDHVVFVRSDEVVRSFFFSSNHGGASFGGVLVSDADCCR